MPHKTVTVSAEDVDAMDLDDDEGFMQPPPSTQVFWQSSQTPAWAESTMRKDPRVSSKRERGASVDSTLFTPTSTFSNQASFAQPSQRQSSRWRNTRRGRPSAGNADEDQHPFSPELLNTLKACGSVVDRKVSAASSSVPQKRRATKQSLARTASESSASMSRAQQESPSSSSTDITMSSFSSHGGTSFDYSNSSHDQTSLFGSPPKLTSSRSVPSAPTAPSVGPSRSRPPSHRQVPYSTPPKLPISQRPVTKHPTLVDQQLRSAEKPARRNTKPNNDILPSFDFSSNTMAVSSRTRPKPTIEIPQSVQGSHRQQDQSPVGGPPASGKRLGMRPSVPVSQSTTRGKSTFSAKQKPFKSPLLRKVDNSNSGNMQVSPTVSENERPTTQIPEKQTVDNDWQGEEGDISIGDVSFDFNSDDLSNIPDLNT